MDIPQDWSWHVSGWTAGCARSGCYYDFNVTVPTIEGQIGGVKAYCSGNENGWYRNGNWYTNCQILEGVNNGVAAKLSERESDDVASPGEILLSFEYAGYEDRSVNPSLPFNESYHPYSSVVDLRIISPDHTRPSTTNSPPPHRSLMLHLLK